MSFAKKTWEVDLVWKGNSLPHSTQHDSSSCSPCVINLLEQLVCKDAVPWIPQRAISYRASLFIQIAQYALKEMVSLVVEIMATSV